MENNRFRPDSGLPIHVRALNEMNHNICASCQWLSANIRRNNPYASYENGDTCELAWAEQMDFYVPILERTIENDNSIHDNIKDKKFIVPVACPYRLEHLVA